MTNHTLPRFAGALITGLLVLASLGAPMAASAADPVPPDAQPADAQPTDTAPSGDAMEDGFDGEVVFDPYFVSPEPDATPEAAPVDALKGDIGRPALTPPATDTITVTSGRQGGAGALILLAGLATLSITVVALGRIPVARRR